jgi:hypothetical protein
MRIILTIILFFILLNSNGQVIEQNQKYFSSLKEELKARNDVKDVKLYQKKYLNGKIKCQELLVNYSADPGNRYWIIGQVLHYYRNGKIKVREYFDLNNNVPVDTGYIFYKKK